MGEIGIIASQVMTHSGSNRSATNGMEPKTTTSQAHVKATSWRLGNDKLEIIATSETKRDLSRLVAAVFWQLQRQVVQAASVMQ